MNPILLEPSHPAFPSRLRAPGRVQPEALAAIGNLDLLKENLLALFCSARCPGDVILPAYDSAARWRDTGQCVISGFHSPVEKECLRILLRGSQPIIICPARSLERMRIPPDWQPHLTKGRLLLLSPFSIKQRRVTRDLARSRNEFVATLADQIHIVHSAPGSTLRRLSGTILSDLHPENL
jgi:predicted Rossmann fold nucleotide-binding protein DprA/Smf involved in DNA uptake